MSTSIRTSHGCTFRVLRVSSARMFRSFAYSLPCLIITTAAAATNQKMNVKFALHAPLCLRFAVWKKFKVRAHYFKLNVNSMFHSRHESRGSIIIVIMTFAIRMHKAMRRCCIYGRAQPTTPIHTIYLCFAKRSQTIPNSKVRFTLMRCLTHQNWKQKKKCLMTSSSQLV